MCHWSLSYYDFMHLHRSFLSPQRAFAREIWPGLVCRANEPANAEWNINELARGKAIHFLFVGGLEQQLMHKMAASQHLREIPP